MIAWWWLLVMLGGLWIALTIVSCAVDREVREQVFDLLIAAVMVPGAVLSGLLARFDIGGCYMSPRAVSRFAAQRTGDDRPAWLFWYRGRGILIVRSWKLGSDRPVAQLSPEWTVGDDR